MAMHTYNSILHLHFITFTKGKQILVLFTTKYLFITSFVILQSFGIQLVEVKAMSFKEFEWVTLYSKVIRT